MAHGRPPWRHLDNVFFGALQFLFWGGFGMLVIFIIGYMDSLGYGSLQIGYLRAIGGVGAILGSLLWGGIADRSGKVGIVAFAMVFAGAALFPLFVAAEGRLPHIIVAFTVVSFVLFPVPALIDSWTVGIAKRNPAVSYGITRAMGSLGVAGVTILAGRGFDRYGISYLFPVYAAILFCLLPVIVIQIIRTWRSAAPPPAIAPARSIAPASSSVPAPPAAAHSAAHSPAASLSAPAPAPFAAAPATPAIVLPSAAHPLLNPPLLTFLLICVILVPCFIATLNFMPLLMVSIGGTHRHVGVGYSLMALSEIPCMIFSAALLRRFRDTHIIAVSTLFFLLRVFSFVFVQTPAALIAVHLLQGASFGLFFPAATALCARIVPSANRTRALALLGFVFFGIGNIISSLIGGWLIEAVGIRSMYAVLSAVMLLPISAYWYLFIARRQPRRRP